MGRNMVLIGIGQSGCTIADLSSHKMQNSDVCLRAIAMDTDERTLEDICYATAIPMVDSGDLNSVVEALGAENIRSWFPCDWEQDHTYFTQSLSMNQGSNQWRMKALLSFASFLSKEKSVGVFHDVLDQALAESADHSIELYITASLAGGTGSGLFLPVALYVKKYIESKGGTLQSAVALLTMPDIYENSYTAEQRVKSYANMYAALREYNAVLACTCSETAAENGEMHPFRIGVENGVPELLFDTAKSEYQTPSANPFSRVYLFERVPNVTTVGTHLEYVADIFESVCNREEGIPSENDNKQDAIFGGISLTKVIYPVDRVVDYIGKRQVADRIADELGYVRRRVNAELQRRRGEAHLYGFFYNEDISTYCDTVISVCEDLAKDLDSPLGLLARDSKVFEKDNSAEGVWDLDFDTQLTWTLDESLKTESRQELENFLYPPVVKKPDASNAKKKEKKPRQPKRTKEDVLNTARKCGKLINRYYRDTVQLINRTKAEFAATLMKDSVSPEGFSMVRDVICRDGRYLHPVYSFLRLCHVYRHISSTQVRLGAGIPLTDDVERLEIPEILTQADEDMQFNSKYARLGQERFRKLALDEVLAKTKYADDETLFMADLESVYLRMRRRFRAAQNDVVLAVLEEWINKYRRFLNVLEGVFEDVAGDVGLLENSSCGDDGITVNVGASVAEKRTAYQVYTESYYRNVDEVATYTTLMGSGVFRALEQKEGDDSLRDVAQTVLADVEAYFCSSCRKSSFYQEYLEKNVLSTVLDGCANKRTGLTLSKVFRGRMSPLRVKLPDSYREYRGVTRSTVSLLSREVESHISANPERAAADNPRKYIEKLMYDAGEYSGEAAFASFLPEKEMRLQYELGNLRLYFVQAANELSDDCLGYKSYCSALMHARKHTTQMWNPHVVYTRNENICLPFVNPQMQTDYECDVARAVIYALYRGDLAIEERADAGSVYVFCGQGAHDPLQMHDAYVPASEPYTLMKWAYRNRDWVGQYAALYKKAEAEGLLHIPAQGLSGWDDLAIKRAIGSAEIISALHQKLMVLIADLLDGESSVNERFVLRLAQVGSDTLVKYCGRGFMDRLDANYKVIFNKQLAQWFDVLTAEKGEEVSRRTAEWTNQKGYFIPYTLLDA